MPFWTTHWSYNDFFNRLAPSTKFVSFSCLLVTRTENFEDIFVFLSEKPLNLTPREVVSYKPWMLTTEAEERARCARRASRRACGRSES
jgi:hypothetical protein